jgi:hypothetical protein
MRRNTPLEEHLAADGLGTPQPPIVALQTGTGLLFDTTWREISVRVPAFLSLFAASFVVGYFYAIDISWFSFFSLSEQIVLVLRSLPIAIGATLFLLMILKRSLDEHTNDSLEEFRKNESVRLNTGELIHEIRSKLIDDIRKRPILTVLRILWLILIIFAAVYMFYSMHFGTCISFVFVIICTLYFEFATRFARPAMHIMYWSIKVAIICLFVGYISGYSVLYRGIGLTFMKMPLMQTSYTSTIQLKPDGSSTMGRNTNAPGDLVHGRLIFTGANGVLISVYGGTKEQVRFIRWDSITEICGELGPMTKCGE